MCVSYHHLKTANLIPPEAVEIDKGHHPSTQGGTIVPGMEAV
jgi:hypothetical protein